MSTFSAQLRERVGSSAPAVSTPGETWSGGELMRRSAGAAEWLDAIGVLPAGTVPALLTASASAFALVVGGLTTNRPVAPLGPRLTVAELDACLRGLGAGLLVTEPEFEVVARDVAARAGCRVEVIPAFTASDQPLRFDARPSDVAAVVHTSGTSGLPKPVHFTQQGMAARVGVNGSLLRLDRSSVCAASSPIHHIAGLGLLCVALGAGASLVTFPGFSVENWRALADRGVTHVMVVPTMIDILLEHGALPLPDLQVVQYGASPIHHETLVGAMDVLPGVGFLNLYGQTEGSPITQLGPEDHVMAARGRPELLGSVGRAVPGAELYIDAPGPDGIGEIVARAPHFFKPGADGWLRTGDLGRLDAEGFLYLSGRRGDKIIRGGENIYPVEVEAVLAGHPAVREVAVVGLPDRRWGEIVAAFVVPADPDAPPQPEELRAHARGTLAGFKVPTEWALVPDLPRNQAGKVLRRVLVAGAGC